MPSHDTFDRLFARLDPDAFERCFRIFASALGGVLTGTIAIDGKTLRRSFDHAAGKAAIHMVSLWANDHGLVFGQLAADAHSNEITAIPKLLELLDLKGCTVTIDAIGCQKSIASAIIEKNADYLLAIKSNQPTLQSDVAAVFDRAEQRAEGWKNHAHDTHEEVEKGHGRIERRTTTITWDKRDLLEASRWPGARCLVRVRRERTINDVTTTTTHHYLSSLNTHRADRAAELVRGHWGVENKLHWSLDVGFGEDTSRLRKGHGAENMSRLRRIALNTLRTDKTKKLGIKNKRLAAGWNNQYLLRLLGASGG